VVCFVCQLAADGDVTDGSYARSGKAPPVRIAVGALGREKLAPGLGDEGNDGSDVWELEKRVWPGLGDDGSPMSGVDEESETAETGSASVVAVDMLR